jgi:4a-hydroxytetrahydrobiopterin dehydratase
MSDSIDLRQRRCTPCDATMPPMTQRQIDAMLAQVPGWSHRDGVLTKTFTFPDHRHTMAFVNAVAWVSHREDHHPELVVGYRTCRVDYHTHDIQGISANDFICAAKLDALFDL